MLNTEKIKKDFPIFERRINGKKIVYLDSAASTQKPKQVIDAISEFYKNNYANIHRGIYQLSQEATELYEGAHQKTADFLNCGFEEVVFTRNTTESLNLVMYTVGHDVVGKNDEILLTQMEHHSNIVPWQFLARKKNAALNYAKITKDGLLDMEDFKRKLTKKTKIVSMTVMSNSLGTINNIKEIGKMAKENGSLFILDGAQYVPHFGFDVKKINCDFLAFSSHKMLGPTGIGVLFGRKELLEKMEPFQYGGDMIREVSFENANWNNLPWKFEAGTSNIADGIGFGAALDYIRKIGFDEIIKHDKELIKYAYDRLKQIKDIEIYGPRPEKRGALIAFNLKNIHTHDVASLLDDHGVCIRGGHHCNMPLMKLLGIAGNARASFYIYNDKEDIDALTDGLEKVRKVFA